MRLRFRMTADDSTNQIGWYVDDVTIQQRMMINTVYISTAEGITDSDTATSLITLAPVTVIESEYYLPLITKYSGPRHY